MTVSVGIIDIQGSLLAVLEFLLNSLLLPHIFRVSRSFFAGAPCLPQEPSIFQG